MIPSLRMERGIMIPTNDRAAPDPDQDGSAVLGGAASLTAMERRLTPRFEPAEPR